MTAAIPLDPARERILLLTLAGIQFAHILDFMIMMPLGPVLIAELGIGPHEFGLLVSSYTFTGAASGLAAAAFVDRFERKRLLLAMFTLFGLATLACGLAPGYATLMLARCAAGAFGGVLGSMVQTMVGDLIPFERRGRASGVVMSAFALSTVAGVPVSLFLANHFGWRFPFFFIAALAAMGEVLRDANHLRALAFVALLMLSGFMVIPYITLYSVNNVGIRQEDIPLIYLAGGCATFFTSRFIGRLADRRGKVRVYRLIALCSMLPLLLQTHLPPIPLWAMVVASTVFFVFVPGRMVPAMAIVTSAVEPRLRGTFLSISGATQQLASGAAAWIGGMVIAQDAAGQIVRYGWVGFMAVGATLLAMALAGRIRVHA